MPKDILGREIKPGQWVARATTWGRSAHLEIRVIESVEDGKVYLKSNRKVALRYPENLIILANANDDLAIELESKNLSDKVCKMDGLAAIS